MSVTNNTNTTNNNTNNNANTFHAAVTGAVNAGTHNGNASAPVGQAPPAVVGTAAVEGGEESEGEPADRLVSRVAKDVAALGATHERTSKEFLELFSQLVVEFPSKAKEAEDFYKKHASYSFQMFCLNWVRSYVSEPELGRVVLFEHPKEFGKVWREATVTAHFPDDKKVYVSDLEFVKRGMNGPPRKMKPTEVGYSVVSIKLNGIERNYKLHYLIGRAFLGRLEHPGDTFDHDIEILKGGTNEPSNLKKATPSQQVRKQTDKRQQSNGIAVLGRRKESTTWKRYTSCREAAKDTGVGKTTIQDICYGKQLDTSFEFEFKFDDAPDPDLPGEVWAAVKQETGPYKFNRESVSNILVSNMGRVQTRQSANASWTRKYRKVACKGDTYARVQIGRKNYPFHVVVFYTFFIGPLPREPFLVDHADRDKANNCITNLRPLTASENSKNKEFRVAVATKDGINFVSGNGVRDLVRKMNELTEEKWAPRTLTTHLAKSNVYFYKNYWVFYEENRSSFDDMIARWRNREVVH